ncbi:MAG: hypothetical protein IMZ43_09550 [Thermoplasmata archaeon]|nr:hypothetical protein [Thermoplasmata archaeon]
MICSICKEIYYSQTTLDPAEPCLCGQMAHGTPWQWDRFNGVMNWLRYWIARKLFYLGCYLTQKGYRL